MTSERKPEALAEALRDAAFSFKPPTPEHFRARAVRRTRQIKRRRAAVGSALACLLTLATSGALSLTLTGHAPRGTTAADNPTTTRTRAASAASDTASPQAASTSAGAGSVTKQRVLQTFQSALPAGAHALQTQNPEQGTSIPWASGPQVNGLTGNWYVAAGASLESANSTSPSTVSIAVQHGVQTTTCAEATARNPGSCTTDHVHGGSLILDKTPHRPDPVWEYSWNSPTGNEVDLSIGGDSPSDFALTEQQVIAVLTDPAWDHIAAELPAPVCVGGQLTQTTPTTASATAKLELECSLNGKIYPMN